MGVREISPESFLRFRRPCWESLQLPWARQNLILAGPLPLHRSVRQRCRVMGDWQVTGSGDNDHALFPQLHGLALNGRGDRVRSWNPGSKAAIAAQLAGSGCRGADFRSPAHAVQSAARDRGRTSAERHDVKHIKTRSEFWPGSPPGSKGPIGESRRASSIFGKSTRDDVPFRADCDTRCQRPYPSRYFADARVTIAPTPRMRSKNPGQVLPTQSG